MQLAQKHATVFVQAYKTAKRGLTGDTQRCYYVATVRHATVFNRNRQTGETEDMPKIKRLINRLVKWLTAHGISPAEIADCIEYITR